MSDWRPYEQCRENEFRARMEREPGLKWLLQWAPYLCPFYGLVALADAAIRVRDETMAYRATDIAR